jgi:CheY-like chemotaxis protein
MSANVEPRILVVDDCGPLCYLKAQYLREAGFQVSQADTGTAALRSMESELPSLVLLDVNLPDMHGGEVCREIKTRWAVPVVYTSSVDIPVALHGTAEASVVGLDEQDLLSVVRQTLHERSCPTPAGSAGEDGHLPQAEPLSLPEPANQTRAVDFGVLGQALDASTAFLLVLNENWEIVLCNRAALHLTGAESLAAVVGLPLRVALHCARATPSPQSAGTTGCRSCAAVRLVPGEEGVGAGRECRISGCLKGVEETSGLTGAVRPIEGADGFFLCTLEDGREEQQRESIRRFLHDILNVAGGIKGLVDLLPGNPPDESEAEIAAMLKQSAVELLAEIHRHRQWASDYVFNTPRYGSESHTGPVQ